MEIITLITGLIVGAIIGFLGSKLTQSKAKRDEENAETFKNMLLEAQESLESERTENKTLIGEIAGIKAQLNASNEKLSSQKEEFEKMKESLKSVLNLILFSSYIIVQTIQTGGEGGIRTHGELSPTTP